MFSSGKTGDCEYWYKVRKENEGCENEEDAVWLYGKIVCKNEGERFLRYAYNYAGDMSKFNSGDFKIKKVSDECNLVIDSNGKVTCTCKEHTTEESY